MLELKQIVKDYVSGNETVHALRGITLSFRKSEFVSILGQSGCGKTTLLNIIGGLDQYTSGDLVIDGRSTKDFKDKDWDNYRNHSIGFVFQSYNLIPHQNVLSNVELALTLSGVSREERRRRAIEALEKQLGREPTVDEVARQAGLSRREVNAALESVVEPISLEEPVYTDGGDAMYVIDQVRDPDGEDSWISGLQFRQTVAGLTPREKKIMELRYLQGKTQMEVAQEIGISQAQVSRLEKGALSQFHPQNRQ